MNLFKKHRTGPNWVTFFQILTMHRTGCSVSYPYFRAVDMDDDWMAGCVDMIPVPEGHHNLSVTREAIEWLQEHQRAS